MATATARKTTAVCSGVVQANRLKYSSESNANPIGAPTACTTSVASKDKNRRPTPINMPQYAHPANACSSNTKTSRKRTECSAIDKPPCHPMSRHGPQVRRRRHHLNPTGLLSADTIDLALDNFFLKRGQRQREKQADPSVENRERFEEGAFHLLPRVLQPPRGRVFPSAPSGGVRAKPGTLHWLPYRTL